MPFCDTLFYCMRWCTMLGNLRFPMSLDAPYTQTKPLPHSNEFDEAVVLSVCIALSFTKIIHFYFFGGGGGV